MSLSSNIDYPVIMMNFPSTVSNKTPNNIWMEDSKDTPYDKMKAYEQWLTLYKHLSKEALIYIMPSSFLPLQDLTFVSNVGMVVPHLDYKEIFVAKFKSKPRFGEEVIAHNFFNSLGYSVFQPNHCWEGSADLKFIRDNIYIGGYGMRTDKESLEWFERMYGFEIIKVALKHDTNYHLDCLFLLLSPEKALVATKYFSEEDIKNMEKVVEIIEVPTEEAILEHWTCSWVKGNKVFCQKNDCSRKQKKFLEGHGFDLISIDLSEFDKSGASLSCFIMPFNHGREFSNFFS